MSNVIGITGGVGSGKSQVMDYLKDKYNMYIIKADEVAHQLIEPGGGAYPTIVNLLGEEVLNPDKTINRGAMAELIFHDERLRLAVDSLIHPMVKEMILEDINICSDAGVKYILVEAALLLEEHYDEFLDEVWYVYSSEGTRRRRLKEDRHYSDDKIDSIMAKQLSEEVFKEYADFLIDNDGSWEETTRQIDFLVAGPQRE